MKKYTTAVALKKGMKLKHSAVYAKELHKAVRAEGHSDRCKIDIDIALELAKDPTNPLHGWSGFVWDADRAINLLNKERLRTLVKFFDVVTYEVVETSSRRTIPVELVERGRHPWVQGSKGVGKLQNGSYVSSRPSQYYLVDMDDKELLKEGLVSMAEYFLGFMENKKYAWCEFPWLAADIKIMRKICNKIIKKFDKKSA